MQNTDTIKGFHATWQRKNGCTSDHMGDPPMAHSGGATWHGFRYLRHYADGCVEIRENSD